jgi:hypothetical protein
MRSQSRRASSRGGRSVVRLISRFLRVVSSGLKPFIHNFSHGAVLPSDYLPARLNLGQGEQVVDRSLHMLDLGMHQAQSLPVLLTRSFVGEGDVDFPLHDGQRCAQLVGGMGSELALPLDRGLDGAQSSSGNEVRERGSQYPPSHVDTDKRQPSSRSIPLRAAWFA